MVYNPRFLISVFQWYGEMNTKRGVWNIYSTYIPPSFPPLSKYINNSEKRGFELKVIKNVDISRGKATMDILKFKRDQYGGNNNNNRWHNDWFTVCPKCHSLPILYSNLLYRMGQDFLAI